MRTLTILVVPALALFAGLVSLALASRSDGHRADATVVSSTPASRPARPSVPAAASPRVVATPAPVPAQPPAAEGAAVTETPASRLKERRDKVAGRLRASGPASPVWKARTEAVTGAWLAVASPELARRVRFGATECHADGCLVEATYADLLSFELVDESLTASDAFIDFPGWRHRAGPIENADGTVTATWFFLAR